MFTRKSIHRTLPLVRDIKMWSCATCVYLLPLLGPPLLSLPENESHTWIYLDIFYLGTKSMTDLTWDHLSNIAAIAFFAFWLRNRFPLQGRCESLLRTSFSAPVGFPFFYVVATYPSNLNMGSPNLHLLLHTFSCLFTYEFIYGQILRRNCIS